MRAYWFDFLPVQFASVEQDGVDPVASSCRLDVSRPDVQQVLTQNAQVRGNGHREDKRTSVQSSCIPTRVFVTPALRFQASKQFLGYES